jgi:chitinase
MIDLFHSIRRWTRQHAAPWARRALSRNSGLFRGKCSLLVEGLEGRVVPSASYALLDLGKLLGATFSEGFAVNAHGIVVGTWERPGSSALRGFVYANGRATDLGSFGSFGALATGINDAGAAVGTLETADSLPTFLYRGGTMGHVDGITMGVGHVSINDLNQVLGYSEVTGDATLSVNGTLVDLGSLAGHGSVGTGINNFGEVVGYSNIGQNVASTGTAPFGPAATASTAVTRAFLYQRGKMTGLPTLGGTDAEAMAVNGLGVVVGYSQTKGDLATHVFSYANGKLHDLGAPAGSNDAWATAINASNVVVGDFRVSPTSTVQHAFVDINGKMTDLNSLIPKNSGYVLVGATAISNNGQIVVNAINKSGQEQTLLLTPAASGGHKVVPPAKPQPNHHHHHHHHRR